MKTRLALAASLWLGVLQPGFCEDACGKPEPGQVSTGCMLQLGDAPGKNLIPGLTSPGLASGLIDPVIDPVALAKAIGAAAPPRTWTKGDRDPTVTDHMIAINGPLIDVVGVHVGKPPYTLEELSLRDPKIELPCGLKVGQPLKKFITTLSMERVVSDPERWDPNRDVRLGWGKMWSAGGVCFEANANITLRLTPSREVREVHWYYFAD